MSRGRNLEGTLVSGVIIVAIGVLLLLGQFGFFNLSTMWRLWPAIFVAVGVGKIAGSDSNSERWWGLFLMGFGGLLLLHEFGFIQYGIFQLWPLFIVGGGVAMMIRSREPVIVGDGKGGCGGRIVMDGNPQITSMNIFSGTDRHLTTKNFRRAQITAIFGGFKLDFTQADIEGSAAVIDATCIFGGGEIRVPVSWEVDMRGVGIFGGYGDKTVHLPPDPERPAKKLILQGAAIFGGIEIRN